MKYILRTDGGARGNPGPAGIGAVIEDEKGKVIKEFSEYLGKKTNNQAEYQALIVGLTGCVALGAKEVEVRADSELLVKQMAGIYRVKNPDLGKLFLQAKKLELQIGRVKFRHVRREENAHADALANQAMDRGMAS